MDGQVPMAVVGFGSRKFVSPWVVCVCVLGSGLRDGMGELGRVRDAS